MVKKLDKKSPFFPVLLSALVAPGLGQIVNKEYAKGLFLLASSLGSFLWFSYVVTTRLGALLPGKPEEWSTNPDILREAVSKLVNDTPGMFLTFQVLILALWIYGIVDAYLFCKKKPVEAPTSHETSDSEPQ